MFSKRIITICLLLLYGVPATVGPHWHHHGGSCCHSSSDACCDSRPAEPASTGHACCSKHSHSCDTQHAASSTTESPVPAEPSLSDRDSGACAICAFYAQAQVPGSVAEASSQTGLTCDMLVSNQRSFLSIVFAHLARGPPSCG